MSEIDTLEEIVEQHAFGTGGLGYGARGGSPPATHCSQGHELNAENTRHRKQGKRIRRICRICDKATKRHVRYSAQGYPL